MKFVFWVLAVLFLIVTIDFVMSNGQIVQFSSWLLPWTADIPVGLAVLLALAAGLLIGSFMAWTSGGRVRRRARMAEREVESLQRELSAQLRRAQQSERDAIATALPEPQTNDHEEKTDRPSASTGGARA